MSINNNDNSIADERRQVSILLLTVLQACINEQVESRLLDRSVGKYLYDVVRNYAKEQGYIQ